MKYIFSMKMAVFMLFSFGALVGIATFIENDYGTQTARALIYKAQWFEVFLAYFVAILVYNILKYKSYKTKPAVFLFHFSFLVIAIGAITTRYIGYEGIMHIREGASSNTMVSDVKILQINAKEGEKSSTFEQELYFSTMTGNSFTQSLSVGDKEVKVDLLKYLPTAHEKAIASPDGKKLQTNAREGGFDKDTAINGSQQRDHTAIDNNSRVQGHRYRRPYITNEPVHKKDR